MRIDNKTKNIITYAVLALLLLLACLFMYDFYKCLSGFIANGFREPSVMLPMVFSYFLPVLCFLFFIYDFSVKPVSRIAKLIYSALVTVSSAICLIFVFMNIGLYISNNSFGVYDALPSVILRFPFDVIAIHICLIALGALNATAILASGTRLAKFRESLGSAGLFKLSLIEYLPLCLLAIVVFVFTGSSLLATFTAFDNAFYDFRYIFLLVWVFALPMMNLLFLVLKPHKMNIGKGSKLISLSCGIGLNLIFAVLVLVLELTYPDFMVHIGKPLFLIAFSVSLPIEMIGILAIMAIGTLIMTLKLIAVVRDK